MSRGSAKRCSRCGAGRSSRSSRPSSRSTRPRDTRRGRHLVTRSFGDARIEAGPDGYVWDWSHGGKPVLRPERPEERRRTR